jgi:hypothetical protein
MIQLFVFFYLLYQTRHKKPIWKHSNTKESRREFKFIISGIQWIVWIAIESLLITHILARLKLKKNERDKMKRRFIWKKSKDIIKFFL